MRFVALIVLVIHAVAQQPADAIVDVVHTRVKLMSDLTASFRRGHDEVRLLEFEEGLQPMFRALPKNSNGNLGQLTARYALNRFFMEKHGWSIEGLAPVSSEREATPMSSLSEWMPAYLVESVEQLFGTTGVNLHELAVVGAVFEDLIHREASARLEEVYEILDYSKTEVLHAADAFNVIKAYMTMYTSGGNTTVRTKTDLLQKKGGLNRRTKLWLQDVQTQVAESESLCDDNTGDCGRLDFKAATRVVEEIGEQYRSFNERECEDLTSTLEQSADLPGKVNLADFYSEGLHGSWNFTETPEYLRALGALEDDHVLIPNYVSSRPNCLATSSIYVVCCRSQCESMIGQLEIAIEAPVASVQQIVQALAITSAPAIQELDNVAQGGLIPLHGHKFALWLHYTYPRFCPRPHMAGVSHVWSVEEWAVETGTVFESVDVTAAITNMIPEESADVVDSQTFTQITEVSNHFVMFSGLLALLVPANLWLSQGVFLDVDRILAVSQFGMKKKVHPVRLPLTQLVLLLLSIVATVFVLDQVLSGLWMASIGDLVLGITFMVATSLAACTVWRRKQQTCERIELPVV